MRVNSPEYQREAQQRAARRRYRAKHRDAINARAQRQRAAFRAEFGSYARNRTIEITPLGYAALAAGNPRRHPPVVFCIACAARGAGPTERCRFCPEPGSVPMVGGWS